MTFGPGSGALLLPGSGARSRTEGDKTMFEGTRDDAPAPTTATPVAASPEPDGRMAVVRRSLEKSVKWPTTGDGRAEEERARMETAARHVMDAGEGTSDQARREELFQLYLHLGSEIQASIAKSAEKRRQSRIWGRGSCSHEPSCALPPRNSPELPQLRSRHLHAVAVVCLHDQHRLDSTMSTSATARESHLQELLREIQLYLVRLPNSTPEQQLLVRVQQSSPRTQLALASQRTTQPSYPREYQ